MNSGIEIVGVILGALPSLMTASKAVLDGSHDLRRIMGRSHRNAALQDFHDQFWMETYWMHRHLDDFTDELKGLPVHVKTKLRNGSNLELWKANEEVDKAIRIRLGAKNYDAFLMISDRIVNCLDQIIKDDTTHIRKLAPTNEGRLAKVKSFVIKQNSAKVKTNLKERIKFFVKEKNRDIYIKNLRHWNYQLGKLLSSAPPQFPSVPGEAGSKTTAFIEPLREIFGRFKSVLHQYQSCNCSSQHHAMLGLRSFPSASYLVDPLLGVEFDLLLPSRSANTTPSKWIESTMLVETEVAQDRIDEIINMDAPSWPGTRPKLAIEKELVARMCNLLVANDHICLRFLVQAKASQCGFDIPETVRQILPVAYEMPVPNLWRLRPTRKKFLALDRGKRVSLEEYIDQRQLKYLRDKRRLALVMAYSVLQSICSGKIDIPVRKAFVFFYTLTNEKYDLTRPFLETDLRLRTGSLVAPLSEAHRFPIILELGILLLEIHTGQPLMSLASDVEKQNMTADARVAFAKRVVLDLPDCGEPYANAIMACLELPWATSFEIHELDMSIGLYTNVISPIERELECLFQL